MSFPKKGHFVFSCGKCIFLVFATASISRNRFNNSDNGGYCGFTPDLSEKASRVSPFINF